MHICLGRILVTLNHKVHMVWSLVVVLNYLMIYCYGKSFGWRVLLCYRTISLTRFFFYLWWFSFPEVCFPGSSVSYENKQEVCRWWRTHTMCLNNVLQYTKYLFETVRNSSCLHSPHIEDNCFHSSMLSLGSSQRLDRSLLSVSWKFSRLE